MVTFATKAGRTVREDVKRASGNGGDWIRNVRAGQDLRVRFLQDPEEWFKYREHYSNSTKFFPCTGTDDCPGCTSDEEVMRKSSRRYAANVLDVKEGKVIVLKLPVDLANRVINKCDRLPERTLAERDLILIRDGNGLDTTYDVELGDHAKMDLKRYTLVNPEPLLAQAFADAWGADHFDRLADKHERAALRPVPEPEPVEEPPPF